MPSPIPPWEENSTPVLWNFRHPRFKSATTESILLELDSIFHQYSEFVCCFTDGSKTPERTTGAYLIDTMLNTFGLPSALHANTAEMAAIYQCLVNLPTDKFSKFIIFTDSLTSLYKIQSNQHTELDAITTHVSTLLHHLRCSVEIVFVWIRGHSGIAGHDIVDAASKSNPLIKLLMFNFR